MSLVKTGEYDKRFYLDTLGYLSLDERAEIVFTLDRRTKPHWDPDYVRMARE